MEFLKQDIWYVVLLAAGVASVLYLAWPILYWPPVPWPL